MTQLRAVNVTAGGRHRHRHQEKATIDYLAGQASKRFGGNFEMRGERFGRTFGSAWQKIWRELEEERLESMEVGGHAFIHYL